MTKENLETLISKIRENQEPQEITPRDLANAFGFERRSYYCCQEIDKFLFENKIETEPNYNNVWIDEKILIRLTPEAEHAAKNYAVTNRKGDPIRRVRVLDAANRKPECVKMDDLITEALSTMIMHNFSQMPVVDNQDVLMGVITLRSIAEAYLQVGAQPTVKSFLAKDCVAISNDAPMLSAYEDIQNHEFVIVVDNKNHPIGIVTISDISAQFVSWTRPYLLTEEIESQIRLLCHKKYPLDEVKRICGDDKLKKIVSLLNLKEDSDAELIEKIDKILNAGKKQINSLDDLTFGQYVALLGNKENWETLKLGGWSRKIVNEQLLKVNSIRNEVMHFSPDNENGKSEAEVKILQETSGVLETMLSMRNAK